MKIALIKSLGAWMLGMSVFIGATTGPVQPTAAALVPPALTATSSSSYIKLNWTDPNTNESGYTIERGLSATGGFVAIAYTGPDARFYYDSTVTTGTTYYYQVRAYDSTNATSAPSNMVTVTKGGGTTTAPSITSQPVSITVTAPASATFSVSASGTSLNYQWKKNGTVVGNAATYTMASTSAADSGSTFVVVVTNTAGSVTSNVATLTVLPGVVAPAITSQPSSATVTAPASATFSVSASGTSLNYQWKKNGTVVGNAATYTTPATSTADSGSTFVVVVSNTAGSVTSNVVMLTVIPGVIAPAITSQPSSATVTAPASATFSVSASGTSLNYQWKKNGTVVGNAATYTTPATSTADSGSTFVVVVTNTAGSVTSSLVTLTVNPGVIAPATVSLTYSGKLRDKVGQNNGARLADGQLDGTFTMTLGAGSGARTVTQLVLRNTAGGTWDTIPSSIYWTLGVGSGLDSALSQNGSDAVNFTMAPGGSMTLFATDCCGGMFATGTAFTLTVTFSDGTTATALTTVATAVPSVTSQPSNATVTAPAIASFNVSASGSAPLSYQWQKNGVNIAGATSASYTTPATSIADSGSSFRVVVSNSTGSVTSSAATLTVNAAAVASTISTQPVSVSVTAPASASFSVSANGTAPLTYQWQKNGVNISGATSATYTTPATSTADSGSTYRVVVSNSVGSVTSSAVTLTVNAAADTAAPSIPTGLSASASSCSQININWGASTDTGGSGLKGYNLYRNGSLLKLVLAPSASTSDSGLTPATAYSYNVAALDNAGNQSSQGATSSTNTQPCNLPPVANAGPDKSGNPGTALSLSGASSYDPDGTITSYTWNFGDGATGTGSAVSRAYAAAGTYTVSLSVTDNVGAVATDTAIITITQTTSTSQWLRTFSVVGRPDSVYGTGVATDSAGNIVMVGSFTGPVDFGGGALTNQYTDGFVAKYTADGSHVWSRRIGGRGADTAQSVAVDGQGNVIIVGNFQQEIMIGATKLTSGGYVNGFIAKYSPAGEPMWATVVTGTGTVVVASVAADADGTIAIAGYLSGTGQFGSATLASVGGYDIYMAKLSPEGVPLWTKRVGGASDEVVSGIAMDGNGDMFITGGFQGTTDFGNGPRTSAGVQDIFLAKYSGLGGSHIWSKVMGGTDTDRGNSVAVDGQGNPVITGSYTGTVDFGGGGLVNAIGSDIFLVKYSGADGTHIWSKRFGTNLPSSEIGNSVAVDANGNIALTGSIIGSVSFGGGGLASDGTRSVFVAKFTSTGTHLMSKRASARGYGSEFGAAVTFDRNGSLIGSGSFTTSLDFGVGGAITLSGSSYKGYLVKIAP